jgi:hypothetical protein
MGSSADLDEGGADELAVQRTGGGWIWAAAARIWTRAANGRRPDLGGGGADELAATGSSKRAVASGIRADEAAGDRAATAAEKTATAAKGTATAAGRRDGGWKKNLRNPNCDLL